MTRLPVRRRGPTVTVTVPPLVVRVRYHARPGFVGHPARPVAVTVARIDGKGLRPKDRARARDILPRAMDAADAYVSVRRGPRRTAEVLQALGRSAELHRQVWEQAEELMDRDRPYAEVLAERYGVSANLIYQWVRRGKRGQ